MSEESHNILVLAEEFYPSRSGGAFAKWEFCKHAAGMGHDVTVFTTRDMDEARSENINNISIYRPIGVPRVGAYSWAERIIRIFISIPLAVSTIRWVWRNDIDVVFSTSHLTHWIGTLISTLFNKPLVSFVGYTPSVSPDPELNLLYLLETVNFRLFFGQVSFCRSDRTAEQLKKTGNSDIKVVNGILDAELLQDVKDHTDRKEVRKELGFDDESTLITFVGRFSPIKRPGIAVDIVSELPETYHLMFVGDGPLRPEIERDARRRNLTDRTTFTGELSHEDALRAILASDALIITSEVESYSATGLEAAVLGTPLFSTPVGVLPQLDSNIVTIARPHKLVTLIEKSSLERAGFDSELLNRHSGEHFAREIMDGMNELLNE